MKAYKLDASKLDIYLVGSTQGERIVGHPVIAVSTDPLSKSIVDIRITSPSRESSKQHYIGPPRKRSVGGYRGRVYRVYCELKLNKRRKGKRRLLKKTPAPLEVSQTMNECWSADFMSDELWGGPRFRTFNVVDDFNREALAVEVDFSLTAERVVRTLHRIAATRGYPLKLRLDHGPEFISLALAEWAEQHGVALEFIKPGKPMQNCFIERFNRSYREAVLDMFVFQSLDEVREQTEQWLKEYKEERPNDSLGDITQGISVNPQTRNL
jgi:putative transposase